METTTSSDDARTTCALRLVVVVVVGVALLFAEEEEEVDFTDIKPEERSDLEEVIVKLIMINGKVNFVAFCLYRGACFFDL